MKLKISLILFLVLSTFSLSGCGKMIQDFVSKDARTPIAVIVDPIAANTSTNVIKLSPGSGTAAGAQVQGKFTLTPTSQITKGSQVEARVTLSQTRVK